jgi:hypothetical protein
MQTPARYCATLKFLPRILPSILLFVVGSEFVVTFQLQPIHSSDVELRKARRRHHFIITIVGSGYVNIDYIRAKNLNSNVVVAL